MGSSKTPSWAAPFEAQNRAAAGAAQNIPIDRCPVCATTLLAPRTACPQCGRQGWCPACGQSIGRAYTARCQHCAAPTACPYCGHNLKATNHDPCPACGRPVRCQCGYDLTCNTDGRCPECWRPVAPVVRGPGIWPPLSEDEERRTQRVVGVAVRLLQAVGALAVVLSILFVVAIALVIVHAFGG